MWLQRNLIVTLTLYICIVIRNKSFFVRTTWRNLTLTDANIEKKIHSLPFCNLSWIQQQYLTKDPEGALKINYFVFERALTINQFKSTITSLSLSSTATVLHPMTVASHSSFFPFFGISPHRKHPELEIQSLSPKTNRRCQAALQTDTHRYLDNKPDIITSKLQFDNKPIIIRPIITLPISTLPINSWPNIINQSFFSGQTIKVAKHLFHQYVPCGCYDKPFIITFLYLLILSITWKDYEAVRQNQSYF